jgi:ABC-2 type transport system ATP-binding protein
VSALSVRGLTKVYGDHRAVDDLTFEVPWGRVTGFLGPNGAGKSTTMRMVLGLVHPSSGDSEIAGRAYRDIEDPLTVVGALLETQQFHPLRSARNHLRALGAVGSIQDAAVDRVLSLVELDDVAGKKVGEFSLGMRQRLGLAAALLGDPDVLILDEPANGLDPAGMRWLRSFLRSYASGKRAVFVSSHVLGEISQMVDDVVVINRGRLVLHTPIDDLLATAESAATVRTREPERLRDLLVAAGASAELISHDTLVARGTSAEEVGILAAREQIPLLGLGSEEGTLEDIFLELTSTGGDG